MSFLNKGKKIAVSEMINAIITKFAKFRQNKLTFQPLKKPINIEVYGDTSLDGDNQQGLLTLMREGNSEKTEKISWRSRQSERKASSKSSGEARVMQHAIDKATHLKALSNEIGLPLGKTTVLTDNLSLRRVIQSQRPTQEQGLRRDLAIIRDQIVYNDISVRFVKSKAMLADHLTKERSGEQMYDVLSHNKFERVEKYDSCEVTAFHIREAAIDIPLLDEQELLHVDVETLIEVIGHESEDQSSSASNSSVQERQLTSGRKITVSETRTQPAAQTAEEQRDDD